MSAPPKPWEVPTPRNCDTREQMIRSSMVTGGRDMGLRRDIPPLPPRLHRASRPMMSSLYGSQMGGYSAGYGGYGGYSPFSSPLGGYGGLYGRQQDFENRYVQFAEESVSPAFESIENIVRGFTSVTMMLESTFHAIQLSFRSILGAVENLSRMRGALIEFLSAFAFLKTIYYAYKKILYLLGLVNSKEVIWREAETEMARGSSAVLTTSKTQPSKWPVLIFAAVMFGGPFLVYKYIIPDVTPKDNEEVEVLALYDFDSQDAGEMSFQRGEIMSIKKLDLHKKGWVVARKGNLKGYIPMNRVLLRPTGGFREKEVPPIPKLEPEVK